MIMKVHMLAFGNGEERPVDLGDFKVAPHDTVGELLEEVFRLGQNENQPRLFPSVSVGDVVELDAGLFRVDRTGFQSISREQFEQYKSLDRLERLFAGIEA